MKADSKRWTQVEASKFPHEKEALDYVREALLDHEPYRGWSNLEFFAKDGSINEVDTLVLTPKGLFLVEIKSRGGRLSGDAGTWTWKVDRREIVTDNPLILANQKAKRLKSLLQGQRALDKVPVPYVHAIVFCSAKDLSVKLSPEGRTLVFGRDELADLPGIRAFLTEVRPEEMADSRFRLVDASLARAITRAIDEAGIRPSQKLRRVGSYKLGELLLEGRHFQDFLGTHDTLANEYRRVRIYGVPTAEPLSRDTIARAAKREYQLLSAIEHPGILKVLDYVQHDLGPALLFEHLPGAVRLDHYLAEREKGLSFYARLKLLRQVAEALQNAHEHRLAHRALGPQSLLVLDPDAPEPKVKLFNWQTGLREASSASSPSSRGITGTEHITELVDDAAGVYIAPEARTEPSAEGPLLDVFSLGALAYRLFSGSPPADSALELPRVLAEGQGLNLSAAADGVSERLRRLVKEATNPEVTHRLGSAGEFLEGLDAVEEELTRPSDGSISDPDSARPADVLQKGFTVVRRLGTGSTALALLVTRGSDKKQYVLKLALNSDLNDRLHAEAEVIRKLTFPGVVRCVEVVEIYGQVGLVLDQAGDLTLAQRLRVDGRLPLDLLQRWGEDLLKAVSYLEEIGVPHRDLKPDNLGIARTGKDDALHLVLFDFSLSRAPLESIHAGTRTYLEPFLAERRPRRWDLAAERYAAAVTLHEMATGSHPAWGDGRSDPASLTCEVTLDADHLEPSVKEPLDAFFTKALRRNHRERFDNAQEMLWAWQKAFTGAARPALTTGHDEEVDLTALVAAAHLESPLAEVGLSPNALSALDRAGITRVRDLLARPPKRLAHLRGAGSKTRKDIVDLAALLRARFPEALATQEAEPEPQADADLPEAFSVDALVAQLLPKKIRKDATTEPRLLRLTLGIEPPVRVKADAWPAQHDVARELGISQPQVSRTLAKARERWLRNRNVTRVRDEVQETLRVSGGVLSASELESFVLATRGSAEDEPTRTRLARAVVRAAWETERGMKEPRWVMHRSGDRILLALTDELASWAERLGNRADQLAAQDPLPSPQRVTEALQSVAAPAFPSDVEPTGPRLVRLAASAATTAVVSSRLELYPRNLPAPRALKLSAGAVLSSALLTPEQLQERVRSRYPESEPLPGRPALDNLLAEAGLDLRWVPGDGARPGGFKQPTIQPDGLSSQTSSQPTTPRSTTSPSASGPIDGDAAAFEAKLKRTADAGGYLVLMATPRHLPRIEEALHRRFGVTALSVDQALIREMKEAARRAGADWRVVLAADAAAPGTFDFTNLRSLVGTALPKVEASLTAAAGTPLLLTWPGLLVRYDRLDLLDRLRDLHTGSGARATEAAWVLIPADDQSELPVLDGRPIPVLSPAQYARVPHAWLEAAEAT